MLVVLPLPKSYGQQSSFSASRKVMNVSIFGLNKAQSKSYVISEALAASEVLSPRFTVSIVNTCWANASNVSDNTVSKASQAAKLLGEGVGLSPKVSYSPLTSLGFSIVA